MMHGQTHINFQYTYLWSNFVYTLLLVNLVGVPILLYLH